MSPYYRSIFFLLSFFSREFSNFFLLFCFEIQIFRATMPKKTFYVEILEITSIYNWMAIYGENILKMNISFDSFAQNIHRLHRLQNIHISKHHLFVSPKIKKKKNETKWHFNNCSSSILSFFFLSLLFCHSFDFVSVLQFYIHFFIMLHYFSSSTPSPQKKTHLIFCQ